MLHLKARLILLGTIMPLLGACVTSQAGLSYEKDQIQSNLATICPTPTQWTNAQKKAVGASIKINTDDQGIKLLATEWDRLNEGSKICRGDP